MNHTGSNKKMGVIDIIKRQETINYIDFNKNICDWWLSYLKIDLTLILMKSKSQMWMLFVD